MLKASILSLALLCAFVIDAQENNPLINSAEWIKKGIELHDQGKYKDAIASYSKVDRSDTNYYQAVYELAYSLSSDSQLTRAIDICKIGLQKPNEYWPQLFTLYGNLLDDSGEPEKAIKIYDTAIGLYPAFTSLRLNKGTTYLILKKYPEAEAIFKECILINPYEGSAHYKLGVAAMAQGKIIESFLSYLNYLVLQPNGRHQIACINQLSNICKNADEIQTLINNRNSDYEASFALLEKIVLSKIALDKNYKPLIKLDDPITRQVQVLLEKMEYDESSTDFWMQYYAPLLINIFKEKKFEPFSNRAFSGINVETIQAYVKKNKDDQEALVNYLVEYYSKIRATRELNYTKRINQAALFHFEDGKLYGKGALTAGGENFAGDFEFYYSPGNLRSIGKFNNNGDKEGEWKYYHYNGQLRGKQFFKNGKQEGEEIFYYENGVMSSKAMTKNGVADGENTVYFLVGSLKEQQYYKNGMLDGTRKTFYSNGNVRVVENYKADTLHGQYLSHYNNGMLESTGNYVKGELEGPFKTYFDNGKLSAEGQYKNGKTYGELKRYHKNGQLKAKENYVNGELEGEYVEYNDNGTVLYKTIFKKAKQDGLTEYYDRDNKKFSTYYFDNNVVKSAKFFDKTGKELSASERKSKRLDLVSYTPEGFKKQQAVYNDKGNIEGMETWFYTSGKKSSEINYDDGVQTGRSVYYHANGNKSSEVDYREGERNGYEKNWYMHGQLRSEGWYQNGYRQGTWLEYDELGKLKSKTTYRDDDMDGYSEEYFPNGKLSSITNYNLGWIESYIQFDTTGKEINRCVFKSASGKIRSLSVNSKLIGEGEYKYGELDGVYKFYFPDGKTSAVQYYKRGLLDSAYRSYHYNGKIATEGTYKVGDKIGTWKYYHENGTLEHSEIFVDGLLHGKKIYYLENGNVDSESEYYEGERHGWVKKYDENGKVHYQIKFEYDVPIAYTYFDKAGKLLPETAIPGGNGKVKTYFPDGKPASEFEYADGLLNASNLLYYSNGKPRKQATEVYNLTNGAYKYYHPNGQIELDYNFFYDNFHGDIKIYNEKGVLLQEGYYYNGSPHGIYKTHDDNGKLKETRLYYYGELLDIKTN